MSNDQYDHLLGALIDFRDAVAERFDTLESGVNARFAAVDRRFDRLEHQMHRRFDRVDERFDRLEGRVTKLEGRAGAPDDNERS